MRVAIGGMHTECSTYSPLFQNAADFTIRRGSDLMTSLGLPANAFEDVTFVPLFHARSIPGGPVAATCFNQFKAAFLEELAAAGDLDGVVLIMHGAMHVPGLEDPEGDWIESVRSCVGADIPITVSYDLHGNVSQKIVDAIDGFAAYRTAPHTDVSDTHIRAIELLVRHLRGGARPVVAWTPVPVLLPGEKTSTEDNPAQTLYRQLPDYETSTGVCDANLMVGYVWADAKRATAASVVSGTDPAACKTASENIAADYWAARTKFEFGVPTLGLTDCIDRIRNCTTTPLILADSGDNPTGGGVGDRADILSAILESNVKGAVFTGIAAPKATRIAAESGIGTTLHLSIGNELGSNGPIVSISANVKNIQGSAANGTLEVCVGTNGNHVVLTERRRPFHQIADIEKFGFDLKSVPVLIVKSGYLSPELAPIANPPLMALTDGAVNQDIKSLENRLRPTPTYPFEDSFDWHPVGHLSKRAFIAYV